MALRGEQHRSTQPPFWIALAVASSGVLLCLLSYSQTLPSNEWSRIQKPTRTEITSSIGFYSNGCVDGAQELSAPLIDGSPSRALQIMKPFRNRYYGHPKLIQILKDLSSFMETQGYGVLIGDLGQPRGGPMPYGHASHQSGLDADVWFWSHPEQLERSLSIEERNQLPMISMLNSNGLVNPSLFRQEQLLKLKYAATQPEVQRIFVNPAIKVFLCQILEEKEHAWLGKLRPWQGHDSHFHIRLFCPSDSLNCTPQSPIPDGDGCNEVIPPKGGLIGGNFNWSNPIQDQGDTQEALHLHDANETSLEFLFKPIAQDACLRVLRAKQ